MNFEKSILYLYQTGVFLGIVIVYFLSLNKTLEFTVMSILMPCIMLLFFVFIMYTNIFDEKKKIKTDRDSKIYIYCYSVPLIILSLIMIAHLVILFY